MTQHHKNQRVMVELASEPGTFVMLEDLMDQNKEVRRELGLMPDTELPTPFGKEQFVIVRTGIYARESEFDPKFWTLDPYC